MAGKTKIMKDDRSPSDILMAALEQVEDAKEIVILISSDDHLVCKTNLTHERLKWLLDQAQFVTLADTFGMLSGFEEQ
jgi:hypothetical protein